MPRLYHLVRRQCWLSVALALLAGCNGQPVYRVIDPEPLVELAEPGPDDGSYYEPGQILEIATNLLLFQRHDGGWAGDRNPLRELSLTESYILIPEKTRPDASLAHGNTATQIEYLAHVYLQTGDVRYRDGALRGLEFVLKSQYDNGGWPRTPGQTESAYHGAITLEDDVMPGVLAFLTRVAEGQIPFGFIAREERERMAEAVRRGHQLLLRLQIRQDDERTGWAARYHPETLQPATDSAWIDTPVSLAVADYLMGVRRPTPGMITSLQGLHQWLERAAIRGSCVNVAELAAESLPDALEARDGVYQGDYWQAGYALAAKVPKDSTPGLWPRSFLDERYPAWLERHSL